MTETIKTKIIQFLEESRKKSFSMEEIAEGLGLQKSTDFKNLVQTVAAMEREGSVIFNKKGKVKLPMKRVFVEGTFRANEHLWKGLSEPTSGASVLSRWMKKKTIFISLKKQQAMPWTAIPLL